MMTPPNDRPCIECGYPEDCHEDNPLFKDHVYVPIPNDRLIEHEYKCGRRVLSKAWDD